MATRVPLDDLTKENMRVEETFRNDIPQKLNPSVSETRNGLDHMRFAEVAVTGWEKAKSEAKCLKSQLEETIQLKEFSDRRVVRLQMSLKESVTELRNVREVLASYFRSSLDHQKEKKMLLDEISILKELNKSKGAVHEDKNGAEKKSEECSSCATAGVMLDDIEKSIENLLESSENDHETIQTLTEELAEARGRMLKLERDSSISVEGASILHDRINATKDQVETLLDEFQTVRQMDKAQDVELLSNKLRSKVSELAVVGQENKALREGMSKLELEVTSLKHGEGAGLESETFKLEDELDASNTIALRLSEELRISKQENEYLDGELTNLEVIVSKLSQGLEEKHGLKSDLDLANNKIEDLLREVNSWKKKASEYATAFASADEKASRMAAEVESKKGAVKDLDFARKQISELSEELSQWRTDTKSLQSELDWATERIKELCLFESQNADLKRRLHSRDSQDSEEIRSLSKEKERLEEELDSAITSFDDIAELYADESELVEVCLSEISAVRCGDRHRARELEQRRMALSAARTMRRLNGCDIHDMAMNSRQVKELMLEDLEDMRCRCEKLAAELEASKTWAEDLNFHIAAQNELKSKLEDEIAVLNVERTDVTEKLQEAQRKVRVLESGARSRDYIKSQNRQFLFQRLSDNSSQEIKSPTKALPSFNDGSDSDFTVPEETHSPKTRHDIFQFSADFCSPSSASPRSSVPPPDSHSPAHRVSHSFGFDVHHTESSDGNSTPSFTLSQRLPMASRMDRFRVDKRLNVSQPRKPPRRARAFQNTHPSRLSSLLSVPASPSHNSVLAEGSDSQASSPKRGLSQELLLAGDPAPYNDTERSEDSSRTLEILPHQVFSSEWPVAVGDEFQLAPLSTAQFSTSSYSSVSPGTTPVSVLPGLGTAGATAKSPKKFLLFPRSPRAAAAVAGSGAALDEKRTPFASFFGKTKRAKN